MGRITIIFILILILIIFISGCSDLQERTYPNFDSSYSSLTITELKDLKPDSGNFNVKGQIIKIYTCPPCPRGAMCGICMEDNIVISEDNEIIEKYDLTEKRLLIFADSPKQFELGKEYIFSIRITNHKSTNEPINDIELVGYSQVDYLKESETSEKQECTTNNDCTTGGCSGTICQSRDSEPIFTTCEYKQEYACYKEINCGCIDGKCQWDKNAGFDSCVEGARAQPQNTPV